MFGRAFSGFGFGTVAHYSEELEEPANRSSDYSFPCPVEGVFGRASPAPAIVVYCSTEPVKPRKPSSTGSSPPAVGCSTERPSQLRATVQHRTAECSM